MKKNEIIGRLLSVAIASVMLFSSMTVFAAKPELPQDDEGDEDDGYAGWSRVEDYMNSLFEGENSIVIVLGDSSMDEVKKHFENGKVLVPADKLQAVNEANESEDGTGEDISWAEVYGAMKAMDESIGIGDGTCYIDDALWDRESTAWGKVEEINQLGEDNKIYVVDEETNDVPPNEDEMEQGTYWVLSSDALNFYDSVEAAADIANVYRDDNGDFFNYMILCGENGEDTYEVADVPRDVFENYVSALESACNTFVGKLHEGTKGTGEPAESLKPVTSESASESASQSESQAQEEEPAPVLVNEVTYSTGSKKQSSLEGVYGRTFVAGTIFNDEQDRIKQAAGLSEEEIKSGVVIKYYICNSLNKTMNEKLSAAVTEQGYKVLGVMNCDLYKIYKGEITKIKTTGEALTVTIGVPENFRNDKYEFVVMCYDESGNLVIMQDLDTDKNTITVQADSFGCWAIGYKAK